MVLKELIFDSFYVGRVCVLGFERTEGVFKKF